MDTGTIINSGMALLALTMLEIILGIDNILVISIVVDKLPKNLQQRARLTGLAAALIMRIVLLSSIWVIIKLEHQTLFTIAGHPFDGKDLILLAGGLFLLTKAVIELHRNVEGHEPESKPKSKGASFAWIIAQIMLLDLVFSIDSVITAVGMANELWVMITAVVLSIIAMMAFARPVSEFIHRHATLKILALSFLVLIAVTLIAEGWDEEVPKGYLYFAMGFALVVELMNLRVLKRLANRKPPSHLPAEG